MDTTASGPQLPAVDPSLGPYFASGRTEGKPYLLVKYALWYRHEGTSTEEQTLVEGFPLEGTPSAQAALDRSRRTLDEGALQDQAAPGFVCQEVPSWLMKLTAVELGQLMRESLPSRLKARLWYHRGASLLSEPGESKESFTRRAEVALRRSTALSDLREQLERKKQELAAQTRPGLWGTVRSLFGGRKSSEPAPLEGKAAQLAEEVSELERKLEAASVVDPQTFEELELLPGSKEIAIFQVAIAFA